MADETTLKPKRSRAKPAEAAAAPEAAGAETPAAVAAAPEAPAAPPPAMPPAMPPATPNAVALEAVSLDDKYDLTRDRVFVTGYQALIRMCLMQKERDRRAGLNTAGYVTGYRGSPLGGLDQQFRRAARHLQKADVVFQEGLNEDLAATALWGTQQAELRGEGKYDGVFGIWYGKGPGVDRCGDVFRHANLAGTAKHGGVLALMGDDHTAESSTTAHQSEFHFIDVMMPILNPAGLQELMDYGLYGWALSRYAGVWSALKCVKDTVESTGSIDAGFDRAKIILPEDYRMPPGGLNIRLVDGILDMEARLHDFKRDAIVAFIRANKLNRITHQGGRKPRLGIVSLGKSWLDTLQALDELGLDEVAMADAGIRLMKVGTPWPIPRQDLLDFAHGLEKIIVVEEKRSLVEVQVREELYGTANQPVCVGKKDEDGNWLFPVKGALDPNDIALAIGRRVVAWYPSERLKAEIARLEKAQATLAVTTDVATRTPYFCSGCPHNSSTVVPDGMRAYAGIGCHYMSQWMDRSTLGFTHMGGEGANWVGEAPFSKRPHVFQNLGDGTYNHSGYLAIRHAIGSGVNITYKILFNDAVAMTGGQKNDGGLTPWQIAAQVHAEGAKRVAVVSDDPTKYTGVSWPPFTSFHHRDDIITVQEELAKVEGCTVLIYDQTCAAEKRRRRKRGLYPDPDKRIIINELVCEGCGDCGVQSNCVSLQPLETEFGRKRTIDQSSCNKDFSCVKGFCPSFVTVHGAQLKKGKGVGDVDFGDLPTPVLPALEAPWAAIITGVGGTGIVTIGAILGMAAHLEGKGCGVIDMAGLAQKGGAVYSHVKIARQPEDIKAIRVFAGQADLVLGGDIVVAGTKKVLAAINPGATQMVVNLAEVLPGDFTRNADFSLPTKRLERAIVQAAGKDNAHFVDAARMANVLLGNSLGQNIFMLGYAYQIGAVPLSAEAILKAIDLNGEAVKMNQQAFLWGRRAAAFPAQVEAIAKPAPTATTEARRLSQSLDEIIERRVKYLTDYQSPSYAKRYADRVAKVRAAEAEKVPGQTGLSEAVARYLFKVMAIKDEYEVARLYTDGAFMKQVKAQFDGKLSFEFHMAPPLLARKDPKTGIPKKMTFGPWMMKALEWLASQRKHRGSAWDPFWMTAERRMERKLRDDYEKTVDELIAMLTPQNHALAVGIAAIPEKIRGFGHVKERHLHAAKAEEATLLAQFRAGGAADQPLREAAE